MALAAAMRDSGMFWPAIVCPPAMMMVRLADEKLAAETTIV